MNNTVVFFIIIGILILVMKNGKKENFGHDFWSCPDSGGYHSQEPEEKYKDYGKSTDAFWKDNVHKGLVAKCGLASERGSKLTRSVSKWASEKGDNRYSQTNRKTIGGQSIGGTYTDASGKLRRDRSFNPRATTSSAKTTSAKSTASASGSGSTISAYCKLLELKMKAMTQNIATAKVEDITTLGDQVKAHCK